MTFGIGSFAATSVKTLCNTSANTAPFCTYSMKNTSCLPSFSTVKSAGVLSEKPIAESFLINDGAALPSLSKPTETGNTLSFLLESAACADTFAMLTAKRRGVAYACMAASLSANPSLAKASCTPVANALESFSKAFGGSSSVNSSINKSWVVMFNILAIFL